MRSRPTRNTSQPASRWARLLFADKRRHRGAALSRGVGGRSFVQPRILLELAYLGKYNTGEAIKQFDDAPVASQVVELKEGLGEPRPGCAASPGREAGRGGRFSQGGRPHRAAESPGQPAAR